MVIPVDDYGLEVIRKGAELDPTASPANSKYRHRVKVTNSESEALPVFITNAVPSTAEVKNVYAEVISVSASVETTITSYTVPVGKSAEIYHVQVSGDNVADYKVKINGSLNAKKRTYFTEYNAEFFFAPGAQEGLKVTAGDVILVTVEHTRTAVGAFEARILLTEY